MKNHIKLIHSIEKRANLIVCERKQCRRNLGEANIFPFHSTERENFYSTTRLEKKDNFSPNFRLVLLKQKHFSKVYLENCFIDQLN